MISTKKFVAGIAGATLAIAFAFVAVASAATYTFTQTLSLGKTSSEVKNLQIVLNMSPDTQVSASGAGSPGNESMYFGAKTKAAVIKFQAKNNISPRSGIVGPLTRGILNNLGGVVNPPVVPPVGGVSALSVTAGTQPVASLAPTSAARVPFTTITLTAGSSDVTVNSITVEKAGLGDDAVFSGVVLLNSAGQQIGISKTLNSDHRAMVGEPWVIKAGTSQTVTVAGNMSASLTNYAGQVIGLKVVAVNTSATVNGALPIVGAYHTINASLSLGSATLQSSSFDPNSSVSKEIGTTGYKFSGFRVQAGSAEKIRLWSVRFNQSGSASSNDLANVVINVDGTDYPTTLSADGKYYTASFGANGILIDKGFSKDVYIKGDIIGTGAAGRTVMFDIYKNTDIYVSGDTYGYGIVPTPGSSSSVPGSRSSSTFTTGTPFFFASQVTVNSGSVTAVAKASSVPAQNIAINVPNQPLGGFTTDLKGEPISVQTLVFTVATSGTGTGLLTNVSIVDENGSVVAGPVDASGAGTSLTFTNTITFPVGLHTYTLKGKLPSTFTNNGTITLSTTPSSQWSTVTGQITGNTISLSGVSLVTMNTMTVRTASLALGISTDPVAQTVVAGGQLLTFANLQFDATQSGEDVRFSTVPVTLTVGSGSATDITTCQLFDGATSLTTGSNTINPSAAGTLSFSLDQSLIVSKGTVKTIAVKCNIKSTASGSYKIGFATANISALSATGVTSSNSVTASGSQNLGQLQTVGSGSLVASADSSTPSYTIASAGSTGVTAGVIKFRATNEAVNLTQVGLKLTNAASSSASNLTMVSLYDGATKVGSAVFVGSNTNATSTLSSVVVVPKDTDKTLTVKIDLADIGVSSQGTEGALIAVDVDTNGTNTQGTGVSSGTTINSTGSTAFAGVRVFKSFPTLAKDTLSSTGVQDGTLLRFKVTADAKGPVGVQKFVLNVATTSATVTNVNVFAFTDAAYSQPVSGLSTNGQMMASNVSVPLPNTDYDFWAQTAAAASTTVQVPAGQTRYFEVRGTVAGVTTGSSVTVTLAGDAAYPSSSTLVQNTAGVQNDTNNDFIWSPNATTTAAYADNDWTNGFGVMGLPSSGIIQTRSN